jgi:signal peptidase II
MARYGYLSIAGVIFAIDRITKVVVEQKISVYDNITVIPGFFDLVHTKNRGAAFGILSEGDGALRTFFLIGVSMAVLCFISIVLMRPGRAGFPTSRTTSVALALIMGGALGNIYDRIAYGMVTDFLEFYQGTWRFAAFNVADAAITTGACLLLLDMWLLSRKGNQGTAPVTPETGKETV